MRLRQLEYFVAICEAGSFTAAADRLFVAQPSLSQQIKALETELECRLLERTAKGVAPTAAGEVFLEGARATLAARDAAVEAVRGHARRRSAEIQILTLRSIASGILARSLPIWADRNPGTVVRLHDFTHRRILEDRARLGEGDLAVGPRPDAWAGPVELLGYEEMVLVFPSTQAADRTSIDAESLNGLDWVLYEPHNGLTEVIEAFCDRYGIEARPRARTDQADLAVQMALDGLGIAMVPESVVPDEAQANVRRAADGVFRAVTVYTRRPIEGAAAGYLRMLTELDLGLHDPDGVPAGAIVL